MAVIICDQNGNPVSEMARKEVISELNKFKQEIQSSANKEN